MELGRQITSIKTWIRSRFRRKRAARSPVNHQPLTVPATARAAVLHKRPRNAPPFTRRVWQRAFNLLWANLTLRQRATLFHYGYFEVVGSDRRIYYVTLLGTYNVIRRNGMRYCCTGDSIHRFLAGPDNWLAQKIWLQTNAWNFRRVANRTRTPCHPDTGADVYELLGWIQCIVKEMDSEIRGHIPSLSLCPADRVPGYTSIISMLNAEASVM
jgi:hypothetical protein